MMANISFIKLFIISAAFILPCFIAVAQVKPKQLDAKRIEKAPEINGMLDDSAWENVPFAKDFVQYEPVNGAPSRYKTEVKVIYDDQALYIGAIMYDDNPKSIPLEMGKRDNDDMNADYFNIYINPFNDGQNALVFSTSSSGIQYDAKISGSNIDELWDAVWVSTVKINQNGWSAEIKIPWSAIRFPKTFDKPWGVNFWRYNRYSREYSSWTLVDNSNDEMANQMGELTGVKDIKAPLRLSFSPYVSFYVDHYPYNIPDIKNTSTIFNGGMDMKLGITESFTLDMTLVPDFGQVQSDNIILNLSPFEIKYDEKRQFFTEGTELFSRADLFYSRRIGSEPIGHDNVYNNINIGETLIENPAETQLLNATKISGRISNGLGIGLFNAITDNTYSTIKDSLENKRKVLIQPLTNYNILVIDKPFMKNSYISFINTNVYYDIGGNMANVSGTEFKIADKKNMYGIIGSAAVSQNYDSINENASLGHKYQLSLGKISGNFKYAYINSQLSNNFDPNDLGFLEYNNEMANCLQIAYNFYNPFWKFINMYNSLEIIHKDLYVPRKFTSFDLSWVTQATFTNYLTVNATIFCSPLEINDYYEPRRTGSFLLRSPNWYFNTWASTDYRKRFAFDANIGYLQALGNIFKDSFWWSLSPRMRISDRFLVTYEFLLDHEWHDFGYVSSQGSSIIIGKRDIRRIENIFNAQYIFHKDVSLSFRSRHYWSTVKYLNYYILMEDGNLTENPNTGNHDDSFNAFNIDMVFTWRFAPGSQMDIAWKNEILTNDNATTIPLYEDLNNTLNSPQHNNISIKLLYYIDWQYLKKSRKKMQTIK